MSDSIRINCRDLYIDGMYILQQVEKLKEVVEEMKSINEDIKDSWDGTDYDAFYSKFDYYLSSLDDIETVLTDNAEMMKKVAKRHGNVDNDLIDTTRNWGASHDH